MRKIRDILVAQLKLWLGVDSASQTTEARATDNGKLWRGKVRGYHLLEMGGSLRDEGVEGNVGLRKLGHCCGREREGRLQVLLTWVWWGKWYSMRRGSS